MWSPMSPNWRPTWSPTMISTWLYRQDLAKFPLNPHYKDNDTSTKKTNSFPEKTACEHLNSFQSSLEDFGRANQSSVLTEFLQNGNKKCKKQTT
ncbi:hypothetical protein TNCV_3254981 [Trichonephila clavipes]|nr:hypothetical protein TNCV_3254981 [Trichonephila clavipes]